MAKKHQFNWDTVTEQVANINAKKGFKKDERFWSPDKKKAGSYIIRFLPDPEGEMPFIKLLHHSFKYVAGGKTKWWIENCVNTFGYERECPICAKSWEYKDSAFEKDKKLAGEWCRKLTYISNIIVVKNTANPEDEGKVFLFKYGQKIYDKLMAKWFPSADDLADEDFKQFVPFDVYKGANFNLKIEMQGDFPNYAESSFKLQSALGDDTKIDAVMDQTSALSEFMKDDKFPTNEKTIEALGGVLGLTGYEEEDQPEGADGSQSLFGDDEIPDFGAPSTPPVAAAAPAIAEDVPFAADEPAAAATPEVKADDFFAEFE